MVWWLGFGCGLEPRCEISGLTVTMQSKGRRDADVRMLLATFWWEPMDSRRFRDWKSDCLEIHERFESLGKDWEPILFR